MIRAFVAFALLMFGLAAGATERADFPHMAAHTAFPVDAGQFHHHAMEGQVLDVHDQDGSDQKSGKEEVGHSHPPTQLADPVFLPETDLVLAPKRADVRQEWVLRSLLTLSWSPDRRPPKLA